MVRDELPIVDLFTDGACRGNPGPGGWGFILRLRDSKDKYKERHGSAALTTNNRMELQAAIEGLQALKLPCAVHLVTDSKYLLNGLEEWLPEWRKRNWKGRRGKSIKNRDLWEQLDLLAKDHKVNVKWVKGHSNHPENDRADQLANLGIDEMQANQGR